MSVIPNKMLPVAVEMLPEGYRRLEYLESTGTQWIRLAAVTSQTYGTHKTTAQFLPGPENQGFGFTSRLGYYIRDYNGEKLGFSSENKLSGANSREKNVIFWSLSKSDDEKKPYRVTLKVKDEQIQRDVEPLVDVRFFLFRWTGYLPTETNMRIFDYSFTDENGRLQINLIPCLDANGKPCMFDTVSCKPFYSGGTGEFVYRLPGDGELPAGYTRMEYLESTGTQYIDTGVKLSNESEVLCKGTWAKQRNVVAFVYGARQSYYVEAFTFLANDGSGNSRFQYNEQLITIDSIDGDFEIKQSGNLCFLNDNLITTFQEDVFETPVSAFLFYVNEQRSSGYTPCICKIHSFSISRDDQLQRNFIPCLDDKGAPCMFDTVTRRPFRNAATTGPDFLYG